MSSSDSARHGGKTSLTVCEGMVVKPVSVVAQGPKGLVQPGISVGVASTCGSSTAPSTPGHNLSDFESWSRTQAVASNP